MRKSYVSLAVLLTLSVLGLAACTRTIPCPLCYEDEWSREPFPGEPKQHIKPLTPEELKANQGHPPAIMSEFIETVSATTPAESRW